MTDASVTVDLNADMGESFGAWSKGNDAEILKIVSSANIACGFHAGDPDVMAETLSHAIEQGVSIGAHPGFPDLQGFGRHRMSLPHDRLAHLVQYQIGAIQGMARALGGHVHHLKLHGALANMTSEDEAMASACYRAALAVDPDVTIFVLAGTAQERAARALTKKTACEIFADRAYNDDATLVDRRLPGAMITDPQVAADRMVAMVKGGAIIAESGATIPTAVDTICLHGDTDTALGIAVAVRDALDHEGIRLKAPRFAPIGE